MTPSSTTLAIGASAGSLLVAALVGGAVVTLAILTYLHGSRVFAWIKKTREVDVRAKDLDDPDSYLKETLEKLCEFAQKPCTAADFAPLRRLRHLIAESAGQVEVIRDELNGVVTRFDDYLLMGLAPISTGARVSNAEHVEQLERAMKQEDSRRQLRDAVTAAQQKIKLLRRA